MSVSTGGRFEPRAVLRGRAGGADWRRRLLIGSLAAVGFGSFGAVVVRANDDAGVLAFIRQQTRPAASVASQTRAFVPDAWSRPPRRERVEAAAKPPSPERRAVSATAYAAPDLATTQIRIPALQRSERRPAAPVEAQPVSRPAFATRGDAVSFCVRTCDGYFFPLSPGTGSDAGDAAACRSLCPAAETRVYSRRIGDEMEASRARDTGLRYSVLPTAFRHRKSYSAACSCTGAGLGLATNFPVTRDPTLRPGDTVMTAGGMKVFAGGRAPHREASFTPLQRSPLVDARTRETLRRMEMASLPGRSGIAPRPLAVTEAPARFAVATIADATAPFRVLAPAAARSP